MKKNLAAFLFTLLSFINFCCSQKDDNKPIKHKGSYVEKFNNQFSNSQLYIACVVLNEMKNYNWSKIFLENDKFIDIVSKIQSAGIPNINIDSLIEQYIQAGNHIDFHSDSTLYEISLFVKNYNLTDFIFSGIEDDMEEEMHSLINKIMKVENVKKIYLLYMKDRSDLSSLSSAEGIALNVHLAYYLYTLNQLKKKAVIKALL